MRWFIAVMLVVFNSLPSAVAQQFPKHHPVAGGIAVIELDIDAEKEINAKFGRTPILTFKYKGSWVGVVGIDLETGQGNYLVTVAIPEEDPMTKEFEVQPYGQPLKSQQTHVIESNPCNPPSNWRTELEVTFPMSAPVVSKNIIPFGTRYATPEDGDPELGVVFHLGASQKVVAPGAGIVIDVSKTKDEGPLHMQIDHGMGLYSCLGPISRVLKEKGESVDKGETVGDADYDQALSKGLYWKITLNGALVDPLLFIEPMEQSDNQ